MDGVLLYNVKIFNRNNPNIRFTNSNDEIKQLLSKEKFIPVGEYGNENNIIGLVLNCTDFMDGDFYGNVMLREGKHRTYELKNYQVIIDDSTIENGTASISQIVMVEFGPPE
jgi:hypothetical protein